MRLDMFLKAFCGQLLCVKVVLIILACFSVTHCEVANADDTKPVILLTGFEPFGPQRPPNPSWEGISELNDTEWDDYRIVAHQMPVVWGEPLKHLQEQIQKHHPIAVFSFGQGAPGSFAVETRAVNIRGQIRDNSGSLPVAASITSDGPAEFSASIDSKSLVEQLSSKGYSVRASKQAGQYLCEETLYSLEYIRKQHPDLAVSFCHVPPLGSRIDNIVVDKALIQKFVRDYLQAWKTTSKLRKAAASEANPTSMKSGAFVTDPVAIEPVAMEPENPELPAVKKLIEGYFKSWSEQRMKDYGNCFAEGSVIQEITRSGEVYTQQKGPFVAGQTSYHKSAVHKAIEVPVRTDVTFEAGLARVVVYWKLTAGPRLQFGYDHFTLIKQDGEWKIVNLVFYGTNDKE